ncbi:MAG: helix-turn-helix domain-containing protein [Arenicellales bacterium]|nr:helix-turn-helix domain-containing protein [Arenicellales bacterium]
MHRHELLQIFRNRLQTAMSNAGLNRSQLAERAGLDRSTLSQLLSKDNTRLPRADTLAAISAPLQISVDWLLGLSMEPRGGAAILAESMQVTPRDRSPVDENLAQWHAEASGYKIRYVPSTLPDLVKTDRVLKYEFEAEVIKTADQAIAASQDKLAYSRLPDTDIEVCMPRQQLETFAKGQGMWDQMPVEAIQEQLEYMQVLLEELYPSFRLHLFDEVTHYSAPYTIFGPRRAAVYIGQMYFVFNTTQHVRLLSKHFDDLIRVAVVQANDCPQFVQKLCKSVKA